MEEKIHRERNSVNIKGSHDSREKKRKKMFGYGLVVPNAREYSSRALALLRS